MNNYKIFLVVFLLFISVYQHLALAEDKVGQEEIKSNKPDSSWEAAKQKLEILKDSKLSEEEECQLIWDTLWTWSKNGNLEARGLLYRAVYLGWWGAPAILMPGRSGDVISLKRDWIILGIYSLEGYDERPVENGIIELFDNNNYKEKAFLGCLKDNPKKHCVQLSYTKLNLVPTFEDYAAEVDALVEMGKKQKCLHIADDRWIKRD
ncbi:MAG: hypothetical protein PHX61_07595 [Alphaproteobacteria bacterium]|nr:hypothetical protein [Alphaproteobacteria bacterium]